MKNGPYELIIASPDFPGKRYRNKYAYEHTVVFWENTGKIPPVGYEIHHINHDHRDNRFDNLQLVTSSQHRRIHGELNKVALKEIECDNCGKKKILPQEIIATK